MYRRVRKAAALILIAACIAAALTGCGKQTVITDASYFDMSAYNTSLPIKFEIVFTTGDIVSGELYYAAAPITVGNFVTLCNEGYYDNTVIYRVVADELIQGGCEKGDGTSRLEYSIRGEFSKNGWNNTLRHTRGALSMARFGDDYDSAGSHFFICCDNQYSYNGKYATFGMVTEGMGIIDRISQAETGENSYKPVEDVVIETIRILDNK